MNDNDRSLLQALEFEYWSIVAAAEAVDAFTLSLAEFLRQRGVAENLIEEYEGLEYAGPPPPAEDT